MFIKHGTIYLNKHFSQLESFYEKRPEIVIMFFVQFFTAFDY